MASTNLHDAYTPYNPQEYQPFPPPPPPPGPPPNSASTPTGMPPPPTGGYRRNDPDHVSSELSDSSVNANVNVKDGEHGHDRERGRPNIRREAEGGSGLGNIPPHSTVTTYRAQAPTEYSGPSHPPPSSDIRKDGQGPASSA
jgi:hypothetical protein